MKAAPRTGVTLFWLNQSRVHDFRSRGALLKYTKTSFTCLDKTRMRSANCCSICAYGIECFISTKSHLAGHTDVAECSFFAPSIAHRFPMLERAKSQHRTSRPLALKTAPYGVTVGVHRAALQAGSCSRSELQIICGLGALCHLCATSQCSTKSVAALISKNPPFTRNDGLSIGSRSWTRTNDPLINSRLALVSTSRRCGQSIHNSLHIRQARSTSWST